MNNNNEIIKIKCECGGKWYGRNKWIHSQSKRHIAFITIGSIESLYKTKNFKLRNEFLDEETIKKKREYLKIRMREVNRKARERKRNLNLLHIEPTNLIQT